MNPQFCPVLRTVLEAPVLGGPEFQALTTLEEPLNLSESNLFSIKFVNSKPMPPTLQECWENMNSQM